MKIFKISLVFIALALSITSCVKDVPGCMDKTSTNYNSSATEDDGTCKYEGTVSFWSKLKELPITVTLNGQKFTVSKALTTSPGDCATSGCANYTLPVGTYSYTASSTATASSPIRTWSGSVTIEKNSCLTVGLTL